MAFSAERYTMPNGFESKSCCIIQPQGNFGRKWLNSKRIEALEVIERWRSRGIVAGIFELNFGDFNCCQGGVYQIARLAELLH
jgi:hypothetical protein